MDTDTKRTPQIDGKYLLKNYRSSGKTYLLYGGLLDAAHSMGLDGITTTLVQIPSSINGDVAICHATVTMPWGQYSGLGDCRPTDPNPVAKANPIRMAETRAKARALRDAINASEYEVDEDLARVVDHETGEITNTRTTREVATERSTTIIPFHPSSPTQGSATRRPAGGPGPYEPGGAAGSPAPERSVYEGGRVPTNDIQKRWNLLVEKCLDSKFFTTDADEASLTGKPQIPHLSDEQWEDSSDIVAEGKRLQDTLNMFVKEASAVAERAKGDGRA